MVQSTIGSRQSLTKPKLPNIHNILLGTPSFLEYYDRTIQERNCFTIWFIATKKLPFLDKEGKGLGNWSVEYKICYKTFFSSLRLYKTYNHSYLKIMLHNKTWWQDNAWYIKHISLISFIMVKWRGNHNTYFIPTWFEIDGRTALPHTMFRI